jgi:hypothetical protein
MPQRTTIIVSTPAKPMSVERKSNIIVGLIADPGLSMSCAVKLRDWIPEMLHTELDSEAEWKVEVRELSLPLNERGEVELNTHSLQLRETNEWDYMVYLTDLPKYENNEPLISSSNSEFGSAIVVLPSLGILRYKRLRRAVVQSLAALHGVGDPFRREDGRLPTATDPFALERKIEASEVGKGSVETVKGLRGRMLLLLGMVRSNRPWRLVPQLSSTMAAALATGAFGVFYTSIWSMADYLPPWRLTIISLVSILIIGTWLLLHNKLWESPTGSHHREKRVMYNLSAVSTIFSAVLLMYLVLFAVILAGALIIIDAEYLTMTLGHEVGVAEYINLSWLSASLGTIAGAVGSSLDDVESVQKATYSRRELDRRKITIGEEKSTDD